MASGIAGAQQRRLVLGNTVARATSTLPATTSLTIFNVTGGNVLLTSLVGTVTTAIQGQATTITINHTVGATTTALSTSAGDLNAAVVGSVASLTGITIGGSPVNVGAAGASVCQFVLGAGALKYTTGATSTGSIRWTLTYVPIDDGAAVTAA